MTSIRYGLGPYMPQDTFKNDSYPFNRSLVRNCAVTPGPGLSLEQKEMSIVDLFIRFLVANESEPNVTNIYGSGWATVTITGHMYIKSSLALAANQLAALSLANNQDCLLANNHDCLLARFELKRVECDLEDIKQAIWQVWLKRMC